MRWDVKGVDASSGEDRTMVLEAPDEAEAASIANKFRIYVERVQKTDSSAVPGISYRTANAGPRPAPVSALARSVGSALLRAIQAVVPPGEHVHFGNGPRPRTKRKTSKVTWAVFFALVGIFIWGFWPKPNYGPTIWTSYDKVIRDLDPNLISAPESKGMDGVPRYYGEEPGGGVAVLMTGNRSDLTYAHVYVRLTDEMRIFLSDPTTARWSLPDPAEQKTARFRLAVLQQFEANVDPTSFPYLGQTWATRTALTSAHGEYTHPGIATKLHLEVGDAYVKLSVVPDQPWNNSR